MATHDPKRSRSAIATTVMLPLEACAILDQFVPGGNGAGKFLGVLIMAE